MDSPETRASVMILGQALQQPFFTEMRTNQQLGYIVWSGNLTRDENHYLYFAIQSGEYSADKLDSHADNFIKTCPALIRDMSTNMFEQLKNAAIEKLEQKPKSIPERANKLKTLIFEHNAEFDRDKKTIVSLKNSKKDDITRKLEKVLNEKYRRMVNILMFANTHENNSGLTSTFDNIQDWKRFRTYK
jgi:insulysin